uniref:dolichyl-phosphate-mannose--protein mannosyltransferase n=1 Tax=Phallusia mammillata TaxID=59560 RepID=A0A6F9DVR5_9ASCI|nr:transmembrane and TPR repeat-containing protein 1-like [Phallusia mammillata]
MNNLKENIIVFGLSIVTYGGVATAPFMYDDFPAIKKNADVQGVTPIYQIWSNDFWGFPIIANTSHKSYRPLTVLTFRVICFAFGDWSTAYHVTNILLHATVTLLFTSVCRRVIFKHVTDHASLVAGILFSLHPIHTEAVSGVVGMAELLSSFFFMSALWLCSSEPKPNPVNNKDAMTLNKNKNNGLPVQENGGLKFRGKRDRGNKQTAHDPEVVAVCICKYDHKKYNLLCWRTLAKLILAGCAMLSKESGLTVLGVLAVNEVVLFVESLYCKLHKSNVKGTLINLTVFTSWCIFLFCLRMWVMDWTKPVFAEPDNSASYAKHKLTRFLTYSWLCCVNLWLLISPVVLCYDWSYATIPLVTSLWDIRNFATLLFYVVFCGGMLWLFWKKRRKPRIFRPLAFGISLLVLPFLPASNLFFPVGFVVAERVLYLPSSGFIVLLSLAWSKGRETKPKLRKMFDIFVSIILIFYFLRTVTRNRVWTSREAFMSAGVETFPENAKVHYNWANYLYEHNRTLEAAAEYEKTIELYPNFVSAMNNLATILEENPKTTDKAHEMYVRIIRIHPQGSNAYNNLAALLVKQEKFDDAFRVVMRGIGLLGSDEIPAVIPVARALVKHDKITKAERLYHVSLGKQCVTEEGLKNCEGVNTTLLNDFAMMLQTKGEITRAIQVLKRSLKLQPLDAETLVLLANCFASVDKFREAQETIFRSVEIDPSKSHRMWALASSLFNRGKLLESVRIYERVLELLPDNLEAAGQYAAVLFEFGKPEKAKEILEDLTSRDTECKFDQAWRNFAGLCGKERKFEKGIDLLKTCAHRIENAAIVTSEDKTRCAIVRLLLAKHEKLQAYRYKESGEKTEAKRMWIDAMHNLEKAIALDPSLEAAKQELVAMRNK